MTRRLRAAMDIRDADLVRDLFDDAALARLDRAVEIVPTGDGKVDVLITGWGTERLDRSRLLDFPDLQAVFHAAGSVKRLVSPELWDRGIRVSSSAAANSLPVAEYTLATILLSLKDVLGSAGRYRRSRQMAASRPADCSGAYGVTVGIIGASKIGRRVIDLLRPFDIDCLLYDPHVAGDLAGAHSVELDELLERSDVVSLHAPSLPSTFRMIGAAELARMRDGAILINTARGALVDTDALVDEVGRGRLRAVLDVTDPEPLPAHHPLFELDGVLLTPHIAGSLGRELRRIGEQVVSEVERFAGSGQMHHEVAPDQLPLLA